MLATASSSPTIYSQSSSRDGRQPLRSSPSSVSWRRPLSSSHSMEAPPSGSTSHSIPAPSPRHLTRDAATQYSPMETDRPIQSPNLAKRKHCSVASSSSDSVAASATTHTRPLRPPSQASDAPISSISGSQPIPQSMTVEGDSTRRGSASHQDETMTGDDRPNQEISTPSSQREGSSAASKRSRPNNPAAKLMPAKYETCDSADLVGLIATMLMELIRFNDAIPLADGSLTRFHSRSPPSISVHDYLQRLTTHATLSPPILLSMVYYIDRLCALYPAFTISSLTVHRFLIAAATVASKGLSDSFWTNNTYARVGGVSLKELALLELEFLRRVEWRIVPKPEVLVDYYRSLIARNDAYRLEDETSPLAPMGEETSTGD